MRETKPQTNGTEYPSGTPSLLRPEYHQRMVELVRSFSTSPSGRRKWKPDYSLMYPMWGPCFRPSEDIMLVGRATNGWLSGWTKKGGVQRADTIVQEAEEYGLRNRMQWAADCWEDRTPERGDPKNPYRIKGSAFWQVAALLTSRSDKLPAEATWTQRIAWSNLYKIAPEEQGNPTATEASSQEEGCVQLLRMELESLRPRVAVLMVGMDWMKPFASMLSLRRQPGQFVVGRGAFGDSAVVVAVRPEGKRRVEFVNEVREALSR